MVDIPIAAEHLVRILRFFEPQELPKLRVAGFHLLLSRPAVVRQVVAAFVPDREVDECAE